MRADRPVAVDVAVVGAGPAGVAAALGLARAGRRVLVLDRARFPRDKTCGDGLTTGALRLLDDLGLDPTLLPGWQVVDDVVITGPGGRSTRFPLPRGRGTFAAVVPRMELDAALVDVARATGGVEVADGHGLVAARGEGDRVVLEVDGLGPVDARYAIGADGMWSPLRKALGAGPTGYLGEWHAFRQYLRHVGPKAATELHVWFEPDLLPGYVWSFPLPGGRANVGFGIRRGEGITTRSMAARWPELLARPHIRAVLGPDAEGEGSHRAWPIPARPTGVALTAAGGRALFVGDAAAVADSLTGEGIGQALLTGRLAADAIVAAGALDPAGAARRYRVAVGRELTPDARLADALVGAVRHRRSVRAGLRLAGATPWTRRNFARWLFEDYPRAYLATPGRWREHSLSGPGAFVA